MGATRAIQRGPRANGPALVLAAALAIAVASLPLIAPAPTYDPWAWLLWGREVTELRLSTSEGPAFKPLPVAVAAALAPAGDLAPAAWVLLVRFSAVVAVLLAFDLGRRLSGGSRATGALAAAGVALSGSFLAQAAAGLTEPMLIALALAGAVCARARRPRAVLACALGCALIRVETWPFLLLLAVWAWRCRPALRGWLAASVLLVPLAWFLPELLGSGDLLRSGARARVPNPGQPALAPFPALASLAEAGPLTPWPLWLGVAALVAESLRSPPARRAALRSLLPAAVGVAWLMLVAVMAQAGFSGEPRYALPGSALIAISGAVGVVGALRRLGVPVPAAAAVAVIVLLAASPWQPIAGIPAAQRHQWRLAESLGSAVDRAGGAERLLACGTPYVGRFRAPLLAYHLNVEKSAVEPDDPPQRPGVVFRSRLTPNSPPAPDAPAGFGRVSANPSWELLTACPDLVASAIRVP